MYVCMYVRMYMYVVATDLVEFEVVDLIDIVDVLNQEVMLNQVILDPLNLVLILALLKLDSRT